MVPRVTKPPVTMPRVTVIGLGLMGGSLAMALRSNGLAAHIVGCGRRALLDKALGMGAIDSGFEDAGESVAGSDFVFLCTPVETSIALLRQIAPRLKAGALVSDVGSTKAAFAAAAREIFGDQLFGERAAERVLPGHPLAGRELSGLENASADLFAGCIWVLTPLGETQVLEESTAAQRNLQPNPQPNLQTSSQASLRQALESIGARVVFMTPKEHDRTLAYTSHLPQMLSTALALTLAGAFGTGDAALQVHAGGLRSMLRLAASEPGMWEQIAASNRENIAVALECLEAEVRKLRESLGSGEFRKRFEEAREFVKFVKG
jgi:prephenate dehydrogenase